MRDLRSVAVLHPLPVYTAVSFVLGIAAVTPTPALATTIALVSAIRLSAWAFAHRQAAYVFVSTQILVIAVAGGLAQLSPALQALSTPSTSLLVLGGISALASATAIAIAFLCCYVERALPSTWTNLTIFPALWATAWGSISYVSPVGQLATWSPVVGLGPYLWIRQYLGQWGINWVVAAWASLIATIIGDWIVSPGASLQEDRDEILVSPIEDVERRDEHVDDSTLAKSPTHSHSKEVLTILLILLMVPSFLFLSIPLAPFSDETTPFTVGCALPIPKKSGQRSGLYSINDYIAASRDLQRSASIVVWPESAVRFASPSDKEKAFEEIQLPKNIDNGKYWGVSFEEYIPADLGDGVFKKGMTRNGFALIGSSGPPVLEYYKRKLVPIAESYLLVPGRSNPEVFTLQLRAPRNYNKTDWATAPNYTRPIPITTSICLDLSTPSSFAHLESRPSLILAPARTWHVGVGLAMWEQAKLRAQETGSIVAWCDGGEGGVSGIAGGGYEKFVQVGPGSWHKTIGISYPFDAGRTFYARFGMHGALVIVWAIVGVGYVIEGSVSRRDYPQAGIESMLGPKVRQLVRLLRSFGKGDRSRNGEERPLLE